MLFGNVRSRWILVAMIGHWHLLATAILAFVPTESARLSVVQAEGNCAKFFEYDLDRNGALGVKEFSAFSRLETGWDIVETWLAYSALDSDSNGVLTGAEFNGGVRCTSAADRYPKPGKPWAPSEDPPSLLHPAEEGN